MFSTLLDNFLPFSSNLKLSSANSFNLSSGNGLNLYHTIPSFNNPGGKAFENMMEREKNAIDEHFSFLPQSFLHFFKKRFPSVYASIDQSM